MLLASLPVQLPVFEGPLDLLLQLIEREELDITAISLVQVTDQYLAIIEEMGRQGLADLTAFLVVAAKLVLIKSRVLLPDYQPGGGGEAEDMAADLMSQLEVYRRFKEIAQELARREEQGLRSHVRVTPQRIAPTCYDLEGVSLEALLAAAQEALDAIPAESVNGVIAPMTLTVQDQMEAIEAHLARRKRIRFDEVLSGASSRVEVIVTLLAVLELLKRDRVQVWQEGLFGPIFIEACAPATPPEPLPA